MSEGGVFWWCSKYVDELCGVWEDVVLVLHTLEEKQVREREGEGEGETGGRESKWISL